MKTCICQLDLAWEQGDENRRRAEELLDKNKGSDLYVLPEMWSTGFVTLPSGKAESAAGSPSLEWMKQQAKRLDAAIAGSVAVEEEGKFYNRFYFVKPTGEVDHYDKHHLFTYGGEHRHYTPGSERVVVEWRGVRILLLVCYDLRFPLWARNRKDYDMILYVASWPKTRQGAWDTLIKARAIENQCFVAAVNRVGDDPLLHYAGGSVIVSPYGEVLAAVPYEKVGATETEIDMEQLNAFREKFPVLSDADEFILQ